MHGALDTESAHSAIRVSPVRVLPSGQVTGVRTGRRSADVQLCCTDGSSSAAAFRAFSYGRSRKGDKCLTLLALVIQLVKHMVIYL